MMNRYGVYSDGIDAVSFSLSSVSRIASLFVAIHANGIGIARISEPEVDNHPTVHLPGQKVFGKFWNFFQGNHLVYLFEEADREFPS